MSRMSNKKSLLEKRRRRSIIAFEMIRLDRASAEPLHQQLYRQIRDELRSGSFIDGASRLPSSRALAADLGISRLTVNLAFSKLHAEGYLRSKAKSGTFVAYPLPESFLSADKFATGRIRRGGPESHPAAESRIRISDRVKAIPDQRVGKQFDLGATGAGAGISLVPSIPAVDEFPIGVWERLRAQVLAKKGAHLLRYASNRGDADLRNALAAYLCDFRAARCHPEQIVIVGGMQQAMLISATALLNPGDPAWIEDPCYQQTRRVLTLADARIIPKPLDDQGIVIARSPKEPFPKLIYITPSHEFPLGVTMSFQRRTALLDFARAHNAFVFEDDYDAEFRFTGPPLPFVAGDRSFRPGDLRGNDEQDSLSLFASGLHRCAGTAGRFVHQDPQRDGSTLVSDRPGDAGAIYHRGIFPQSHQTDAKIIFGATRFFHRTVQQVTG